MSKEALMNKLGAVFKKIREMTKKKWFKITLGIIIAFIIFKYLMTIVPARIKEVAMSQPSKVEVTTIQDHEIKKSFEYSGRVEAKYSVDLVARVQGFLQKSFFKEGDFVKKGQVLFLIEPSEYEIAVKNAQAAVNATTASLTNAEKHLVRARELVKQDFVSKSYYDDALAQRDSYKGNLDVNRAQLAQAKLNLSYTRITAPVDGKIGKILITQGNLVNTTKGTIAKLISTNPIYVSFTLKSEDYLKFKKADQTQDLSNTIVTLKLSDGSEYKQTGKIEFVDNSVDMTSGTISMRATFDNPDGLLVPGDYITITLNPVNPRNEILVPMEAVQDSADGFFVYLVNDANEVNSEKTYNESESGILGKFKQFKNKFMALKDKYNKKINDFLANILKLAPKEKSNKIAKKTFIKATEQYQGYWVVDEGLKEGDIIVQKGLTQIRDGAPIQIIKDNSETEDNKDKTE